MPVRVPAAVGVNVIVIVQEAFAARLPGQLFVSAKSPVVTIPETVRLLFPEFVSVTVCGVLVVFTARLWKVREFGLKVTNGAAPVPDRFTVCGLPAALSATLSAPVRFPVVVGVNVTLMVQEEVAARMPGQLFVSAKSPVAVMPEITRLALPEFVSVTVCGVLVLPTACDTKARLVGDSVTAGTAATPVPVRLTVCGLFGALSVKRSVADSLATIEGVNVTFTEQVPLGATDVPLHVSALVAKSAAFAPASVTAPVPKVKVAFPLFVIVRVCGVLAVLTT